MNKTTLIKKNNKLKLKVRIVYLSKTIYLMQKQLILE